MTLNDIYRDIYSRLSLDGDDHKIYFDDIVKAINDAIRELRIEYIRQGLGHEFADTETIYTFTESLDYPFLNIGYLSNKIMQDLPISHVVLSSTCYTTANEIKDQTQTFNEGDQARKDGILYECVEDFSSLNTFDLTFDPQEVRNIYKGNGLIYNIGDIVRDSETGDYYKVNTGFTNDSGDAINTLSQLDKLYWKKIGSAHIYASHYPHKTIQTIRVFDSINFSEAFSIKNDEVFVTSNVETLTLTYIPKWTDIKKMDDPLNLPDFMIPSVKDRALVRLGQKLGIEIKQLDTEEENG